MSSTGTFGRTFTAIGRVALPVIDDVIDKINRSGTFRIHIVMVKTWVAALVMRQKVMMERSVFAAPNTSISMRTLGMNRSLKTFRDETVLKGEILVAIATHAFVCTPRERTMVYQYIFAVVYR